MKPLRDLIWIEVEKRYNDTVEINGQEIFLNPTYNPELHARQHGTVYAVSDKIKDIKIGDKVYTHHFLCNDTQRINFIKDKKIFEINKPMMYCVVRDSKVIMLSNYVFVEQVIEDEEDCKTESGIWFKSSPEDVTLHGILRHANKDLIEQGANIGDKVIFSDNSEYKMNIEGKELMRMRNEDVLAIYK